ncbi:hypothetical protein VZT92_025471 [Zoarces viviparus]|uniref:Uncharacterized protein n=1 Tax=Zoarces viviparus TaxID=48416 RepID=A0AAW1DX92_ZOAVI
MMQFAEAEGKIIRGQTQRSTVIPLHPEGNPKRTHSPGLSLNTLTLDIEEDTFSQLLMASSDSSRASSRDRPTVDRPRSSSRDRSTVDRPRSSSRDRSTVDRPRSSSRDRSTVDRPRSGFTASLDLQSKVPAGGGELSSRQQRLLLLLLLLLQEQSFSSLGANADTTLLETQDVLLDPLEGREARESQNQD